MSVRTLRRLLELLAPLRWRAGLTVLLGAVMVASNIGLLGMAAYLIAASALKPLLIALTLPIYIVRFAGVARAAARYAERLSGHSLTLRLLARLRERIYRRLTLLVPGGLLTYRSGDLLGRLVADVDELQHLYVQVVGPFLVAGLIALLTTGLFALFSPVLAWTALAFLVVAGVGVPVLIARLSRGLGARQVAARAELSVQLVDGIQGVQDILALGRETTFQERIAGQGERLARLERRMALVSGIEQGLSDFVTSLAVWGVLVLAIPLVGGHVVGGIYLAFLALVMLASFEAVQPLAPALQFLGRTLSAGERVFAVVDRSPAVTEPDEPLPAHALVGGDSVGIRSSGVTRQGWRTKDGHAKPEKAALAFEHVSFAYPGSGAVLHDISFTIPAGGRVAIVGPSGAGKSTLARLAVRFYDPDSGVIRLAGEDVRRYALSDLRAVIGVVAQDTYVFNDTLRRNLLLGRPDASDDELEGALGQAQLGELVRQLPAGLDTWAGERGMRFSGGERQRLAIARVLLKDAPLLLLDEPTANLDGETERELLEVLEHVMRDRTTVLITHRLLHMERMDEILVVDGGRVIERGTHAQLIARTGSARSRCPGDRNKAKGGQGLYQRMLDVQNGMLAPGA